VIVVEYGVVYHSLVQDLLQQLVYSGEHVQNTTRIRGRVKKSRADVVTMERYRPATGV